PLPADRSRRRRTLGPAGPPLPHHGRPPRPRGGGDARGLTEASKPRRRPCAGAQCLLNDVPHMSGWNVVRSSCLIEIEPETNVMSQWFDSRAYTFPASSLNIAAPSPRVPMALKFVLMKSEMQTFGSMSSLNPFQWLFSEVEWPVSVPPVIRMSH